MRAGLLELGLGGCSAQKSDFGRQNDERLVTRAVPFARGKSHSTVSW